jgi:hypothetical protein
MRKSGKVLGVHDGSFTVVLTINGPNLSDAPFLSIKVEKMFDTWLPGFLVETCAVSE